MTTPPPTGWRPTPPSGPTPPPQGGPYGQQPLPGPAGPWPHHPAPPPKKNNTVKWLLGAAALLLVIAISVGATLLFARDGGGGETPGTASSPPPTASTAPPSEIASANDTGPVAVITDEPTCETFARINNTLSTVQAKGWAAQRAQLGPGSEWTPEQKTLVQEVATAMRRAADQSVPLAKSTPNRLVRELYEQFIAYGRAYADKVTDYTVADNGLASANVNVNLALVGICKAISTGSASRVPAVSTPSQSKVPNLSDPANPQLFIPDSVPTCGTWEQLSDKFNAETAEWQRLIIDTPASQWTPDQRALQATARPALTLWAAGMESAGRDSGNQVLDDYGVAAAQYIRGYLAASSSHDDDIWLTYVSFKINQTVLGACSAVKG